MFVLDTRTAVNHFPGIGRYVSNLAQAMAPLLQIDEKLLLLKHSTEPTNWQLPPQSSQITWLETAVSPFDISQQTKIPPLLSDSSLYHSPYYLMPYRPGVPTLLTVYDLIPQLYPQYVSLKARLLFKFTTRLALRAAIHIIAISEATKQDFVKFYNVDPSRITAVPLAPAPTFKPKSVESIQTIKQAYHLPEKYVLYLGINKPHKNLPSLIQAWNIVQQQMNQPVTLVIAGAWDTRYPEPKQLVGDLNLNEKVAFIGPVPDGDLPALYSGAELFVFPSHYEGFGLPVSEAMACGTAVACANSSSLPEVGGKAAVYFDPNDISDIAQKLNDLLSNHEERQARQQQSLIQATQFTWTRTAQATLEIYREFRNS